MKTRFILTVLVWLAASGFAPAATNDAAALLQRGLFEEEANHQLDAAIGDYKEAIEHFDRERQLAATAIFRLGECYRKLGRTNEANAQYERIVHEFPDQTQLARLSQACLPSGAGPAGPDALLSDEEKFLRGVKESIQNSPDLLNQQLDFAVENGYVSAAEFLIAHGADANLQSPILKAAGKGNDAMVQLLLSHGAEVNTKYEQHGLTPLLVAVGHGYMTVCRTLLAHGADVNLQSPIIEAANKGNKAMVQFLLSRGADVNAKDYRGQTPLSTAMSRSDTNMVKLLLDNHADANTEISTDTGGRGTALLSPLDWVIIYEKSPEIVKLLLESHADPNAVPSSDQFPFVMGVGSITIPAFETPLMLAASFNQSHTAEIVQLLLDHGAKPNAVDANGCSALIYAIRHGNVDAVRKLISYHADVNALDTEGRPPLAHLGSPLTETDRQIQELLIQAGADADYNRRRGIWLGDVAGKPQNMVFSCPTNSINHYTLFEFIAKIYHLEDYRGGIHYISHPGIQFPDFTRVSIQRLEGKRAEVLCVNVADFFQSTNCSKDVALQAGDVIGIPEQEHKIGRPWGGLSDGEVNALKTCLLRVVRIIVKGTTHDVALVFFTGNTLPHFPTDFVKARYGRNADTVVQSFFLDTVVHGANVLLNTSDLSRVRLTRNGAKMTFDLTKPPPDVWLEDGDAIEIPELGEDAPAAAAK